MWMSAREVGVPRTVTALTLMAALSVSVKLASLGMGCSVMVCDLLTI